MANNLIDTTKTVLKISDIFGYSQAFISLLEDINVTDNSIVVLPYQQPQINFEFEQQAYQCFQEHGSIDAYILSLTQV